MLVLLHPPVSCHTTNTHQQPVILPTRVKFWSLVMPHFLHPVTCHTSCNSNILQITLIVMLPLLHTHTSDTCRTTNTRQIPVTCHVTPSVPPVTPTNANTRHFPFTYHVTPPASSCHLSSVQHKQFLSLVILPLLHPPVSCHTTNTCQSPVMLRHPACQCPVKLTTNVKFLSCHTSQIDVYPPFSPVMGSVIAPFAIKRITYLHC
jgi:hypothetical protein